MILTPGTLDLYVFMFQTFKRVSCILWTNIYEINIAKMMSSIIMIRAVPFKMTMGGGEIFHPHPHPTSTPISDVPSPFPWHLIWDRSLQCKTCSTAPPSLDSINDFRPTPLVILKRNRPYRKRCTWNLPDWNNQHFVVVCDPVTSVNTQYCICLLSCRINLITFQRWQQQCLP